MAIDGTLFDIPDTDSNARVFGYPGTRKGTHANTVRLTKLPVETSKGSRGAGGEENQAYPNSIGSTAALCMQL
jgi:hypothetical protein